MKNKIRQRNRFEVMNELDFEKKENSVTELLLQSNDLIEYSDYFAKFVSDDYVIL